ncbi:MAG: serine dehydratase subunit alpha family protein [Fusobacteriaceae bacterium]
MKKTDFNKFIDILKKEVVPALGCTEPTAVAYAAAKAREILGETPEKVELILSGNVLKNAMSVGIPGTGMKGIDIATAVGIVAGDPSAGLEVLNNIKKEDIEKAKELLSKKFITRELSTLPNKLYIKVKVISKNNWASVEIKDFHTAITKIEKNDTIIFESKCDGEILEKIAGTQVDTGIFLSVKSIWKFIQEVPLEQILFMKDAIILNTIIAEEGLKNPYGLRVGQTRLKNIASGLVGDTVETYAIAYTAAASDARMAGSNLAVMTNSGSGNQGITATVPVIATAKKLNSSEEQLLRAVTLSSLIAIHMKNHLGRLSALCGCVVASTGSSCGISYLLGGQLLEMEATIKNVLGNITGMFCDGAKPGCSLKIATGVSAGIQAALLAKDGIIIGSDEGIIDNCVENTIKNACDIGRDAMNETDKMILNIMINKECK